MWRPVESVKELALELVADLVVASAMTLDVESTVAFAEHTTVETTLELALEMAVEVAEELATENEVVNCGVGCGVGCKHGCGELWSSREWRWLWNWRRQ